MNRLDSRRAVFRALWWRLLLVSGLMTIVVGLITYHTMANDFVDRIEAVTTINVSSFNRQLLPLFRKNTEVTADLLALELEKFRSSAPGQQSQGRFVLVNFYNREGRRLLEVVRGQVSHLTRVRTKLVQIPVQQQKIVRGEEVAGEDYVLAYYPLLDQLGETRLYILGLFEPSAEVVSALQTRILRNSLLVAGIVFFTTLLLYPLLMRLFQRVYLLSGRLLQSNLETLMVLGSAIAKRDSDTDIHNFRVTVYAVHLAEEVGLDRWQIQALIKGAFLHDVGKIGIHDRILLKPGKLDEEEFSEMRRHVAYGEDIVSRSAWLDDAMPVVRCHHEKVDGSGYLQGLAGEDIPIIARIFAIVDVFDALTVRRPYKEPFPLDDAIAIMREGAGQHFDADLLAHFELLAEDLHRSYAERDSDAMKEELEIVLQKYFMVEGPRI